MTRIRPTLRCIREDLDLAVPPITEALDELNHPLIRKANQLHADQQITHERIRAIDDVVLFKVKIQRWRGAVWNDARDDLGWLIAGGIREEGSKDDFYAVLASKAKAARTRRNAISANETTTSTCVEAWLPTEGDHKRYRAEAGLRFHNSLRDTVYALVRASLLDGREHQEDVGGAEIGILVRAEEGHETYVAVRIMGSVPVRMVAVALDLVPGCDRDGWGFEAMMPGRVLRPGEEVWSNIMDPAAAADLIDE